MCTHFTQHLFFCFQQKALNICQRYLNKSSTTQDYISSKFCSDFLQPCLMNTISVHSLYSTSFFFAFNRRFQRSLNTTKKKTDIKKKQTLEAIQGNEFTEWSAPQWPLWYDIVQKYLRHFCLASVNISFNKLSMI